VRLAEPRLSKSADLSSAVLKLVDDGDVQVRMQVAYSLGEWADPRAAAALAALLVKDAADPYVTTAALSSVSKESVGEVLMTVLPKSGGASGGDELVERLLAMAAAMEQDAAVAKALATLIKPQPDGSYAAWQYTALAGATDAAAPQSKARAAPVRRERAAGAGAPRTGAAACHHRRRQIGAAGRRGVGDAGPRSRRQ
jgi:hypothetical protein